MCFSKSRGWVDRHEGSLFFQMKGMCWSNWRMQNEFMCCDILRKTRSLHFVQHVPSIWKNTFLDFCTTYSFDLNTLTHSFIDAPTLCESSYKTETLRRKWTINSKQSYGFGWGTRCRQSRMKNRRLEIEEWKFCFWISADLKICSVVAEAHLECVPFARR